MAKQNNVKEDETNEEKLSALLDSLKDNPYLDMNRTLLPITKSKNTENTNVKWTKVHYEPQ